MAGDVCHLEAVEQRHLGRLLGGDRQLIGELVELLDLVDRGQVGAAELCQATPEPEAGARSPGESGFDERAADVGDRRLRETKAAGEIAEGCVRSGPLREQVEDGGSACHRGSERPSADVRLEVGWFVDSA